MKFFRGRAAAAKNAEQMPRPANRARTCRGLSSLLFRAGRRKFAHLSLRRARALVVFNDNNYSIAAAPGDAKKSLMLCPRNGNSQPWRAHIFIARRRRRRTYKKTHLMAEAQIFFVAIVKCVAGARG
jgi:hypothetical protein